MSYATEQVSKVVLAVHGGTSGARPGQWEAEARKDMERALQAGYDELQKAGDTCLNAVEAAVRILEDSPHFNAGRGSALNLAGHIEMDASIMEGREKRGGAVSCVATIKNPVVAARQVMEQSPHVLLSGRGAEDFATQRGIETVDPQYFETERRRLQLERFRQRHGNAPGQSDNPTDRDEREKEWGTVGAVALDREGTLAAATSTGGTAGKMVGRIGDSPILGAGTYADNEACAVSGTGQGEYFIRLALAHEIAALMKYRQMSIDEAGATAIEQLTVAGGAGGVIAIDSEGNFAAPYNTPGMHRGYVTVDGETTVLMYGETGR